MNETIDTWHLWVIAGVCLFIGEVFLPGFILASLGVGCLVAGAVQYVTGDMAFAIGGFVFGAGMSLVLIRPFISKALGPEEESRFGADAMIGDVIVVSDAGDVGGNLKAKYRDTVWSLRSEQDLFEGDEAIIVAVDGGTLVVEPR